MQNINSISVSNNVMQATVLVRQKKKIHHLIFP